MPTKVRAYTTRKMPTDLLKRMRILAAWLTAQRDERVTLEHVVAEVVRRGLPGLEAEAFKEKD